jgi:hypothetical protein
VRCHVFPAYTLQGLCNNAYLRLWVVLQKCKSEMEVDVEIMGAEVKGMGMAEVEDRAVVLIADKSVSEVAMDGLDDEVEGVHPEEPSISMGSRGLNLSPREISSSLSSGLSASFSAGIVAWGGTEVVAAMAELAMSVGGGVSISGDGTIIVAANFLSVRWCRSSCPSSNSS